MNNQILQRFTIFTQSTKDYKKIDLTELRFENRTINDIQTLFKKGRTPKYSSEPTNTIVIKSGQARGYYNNFDLSNTNYLQKESINPEDERNLQKGDILINTTGKGTAGRVTLFDLDGNYVADSHIAIFRFDHTKYYPFFILKYFTSVGFARLESMATGSGGQIELGTGTLKELEIPIPLESKIDTLPLICSV